jgi:hypothetical protein
MKLKLIANNMTELSINGIGTILFSYETPVAAHTPNGIFKTEKKWSSTTSRHINIWCKGIIAKQAPQEFFDKLIGN